MPTVNFNMLFQRHFAYHGDTPDREEEKAACHWCQIRKFSAHKEHPIAIINEVDKFALPEDFNFIEHSIMREGVEAADNGFQLGCECKDDRDCERANCYCLQDVARDEDADKNTKIYVYHSTGEKKECLRTKVLGSRDPIYECHTSCRCSAQCSNRVVERGRKIPLQIFRTSDGRGWGVRSTVDIRLGQYIDKYVGEIITSAESMRRREESDVAQRKDVYLFALDKFSDPECIDSRLAGPPLEVDGEFYSGPMRFVNHSCDPNMRIFARVGDHADKHIHDLAFFAIQDIMAGTELTFDYVDGEDTDFVEDSHDPRKQKDMTKCLCKARKCRGFLW